MSKIVERHSATRPLRRVKSVRSASLWLGLLALFAALPAIAQSSSEATGKNFALPGFTKEGYHRFQLRGTAARYIEGEKAYHVTDMNLTLFTGDAANRVDTVVLSPLATFLPTSHLARGDGLVRLIRDDMEVTGEQWTYDHSQKKVSLQKNTRIVFRAQLPDLLR